MLKNNKINNLDDLEANKEVQKRTRFFKTLINRGIMDEKKSEQAKKIGNLIKKAYESKGLKQTEAAKEIDVSAKTLQNWSNGTRNVDEDKYTKIAEFCDVSLKKLKTWLNDDLVTLFQPDFARITKEGLTIEAIKQYYPEARLREHGLSMYSITVEGSTQMEGSLATKPDWINLKIPLDSEHTKYHCTNNIAGQYNFPTNIKSAQHGLEANIRLHKTFRNELIYMLDGINISEKTLEMTLSLIHYEDYKFSIGILPDELNYALAEIDYNLKKKRLQLPLRDHFLPNTKLTKHDRYSSVGILACVAIARKKENDFAICIQERASEGMADAQGQISVVPQAYHQPISDGEKQPPSLTELDLAFTFKKEFYEELLGGTEVEQRTHHLREDWFVQESEALQWLENNPDAYTLECTGYSINLNTGDHDFTLLCCIHDTDYWDLFGSKMVGNWEIEREQPRTISSQYKEGLTHLFQQRTWLGGGLMAFAEGFKRLRELHPSKVADINIETGISSN